jgi:hypothetical protein
MDVPSFSVSKIKHIESFKVNSFDFTISLIMMLIVWEPFFYNAMPLKMEKM